MNREVPILSWPLPRWLMILFSVCLLGACWNHLRDVWRGGWLPYRFAPLTLNVYWTSLAFLDPLAALLLLGRPRLGLVLTLAIIVSDVAINGFARFFLGYFRTTVGTTAFLLQALFLLAVVAASLRVWRR